MERSSNHRKRGKGPRKQNRNPVLPKPFQITDYSIRHNSQMRFICGSNFNGEISYQNLLDCFLFAATAIAPYQVFTGVKVRSVEVWVQPSPVSVTPNIASVTFNGAANQIAGDQRLHTAVSIGQQAGYIRAIPSRGSNAAAFQISNANGCFQIICQTGTIIGVNCTYVQDLNGLAVAAQAASVGATVGALYTRGLDGLPVATSKLLPININDI